MKIIPLPVLLKYAAAKRGNHGQSQARSEKAINLSAKNLVPLGNSKEKKPRPYNQHCWCCFNPGWPSTAVV
jgi:hypothetical protein